MLESTAQEVEQKSNLMPDWAICRHTTSLLHRARQETAVKHIVVVKILQRCHCRDRTAMPYTNPRKGSPQESYIPE